MTMESPQPLKDNSPPPSPEDNKIDINDCGNSLTNPLLNNSAASLMVSNPALFTQTMLSAAAPTLLLGNSPVFNNAWVHQLKELQERGELAHALANATQNQNKRETETPEIDVPSPYTSRTPTQAVSMDLCVVCGDRASGRHYGAVSCEGCKGFFKRSIRKQLGYTCRGNKSCEVTKHHRNRCQYCRLQKCLAKGMRSDSVQSERKPANFSYSHDTRDDNNHSISVRPISALDSRSNIKGVNMIKREMPPISMTDLQMQVVKVLKNQDWCSPSNGAVKRQAESPPSTNGETDSKYTPPPSKSMKLDPLYKSSGSENGVDDSLSDCSSDSDARILTEALVPFTLTPPSPVPSFLSGTYISESASRLLFRSVHWARDIPASKALGLELQIDLMRSCWPELYMLSMTQRCKQLNLSTSLMAITTQLHQFFRSEKISETRYNEISDHICRLRHFMQSCEKMQLDDQEYAYLKLICLFTSENGPASKQERLEKLQDQTADELRQYITDTYSEPKRFTRILLKLPSLRALQPQITEELFFGGLLGNVQIDAVIPYIMNIPSMV